MNLFNQGDFQVDPNMTPEQLAERRRRIEKMVRYGSAQSVPEGLTHLAGGFLENRKNKQFDATESAGRARGDDAFGTARDIFSRMYGGQSGPMGINGVAPPSPVVARDTNDPQVIADDAMDVLGQPRSGLDFTPYAVGGAANRGDSFTGLDPDFASSVHRMTADAHAAGVPLEITSAYRSPEVQAQLYDAAIKKYGSEAAARKWVAPPGKSRHNSGTAVDFAVNGSLLRDPNSPEAQWVAQNASNYGLDVPMSWEPWQVEPAGSRGGTRMAQASGQPQATVSTQGRAPSGGDMTYLYEALANPWLTQGQRASVMAMLQQQTQMNDPMRQLQMQNLQSQIDQRSQPDPGYRQLSAEEVAAIAGLDPSKAYQVSPNNQISAIGGGGQTINVGDGSPGLGKLSADYAYVMNQDGTPKLDANGLPIAAPVPGSPAHQEMLAAQQRETNKGSQQNLKLGTTLSSIGLNIAEIEDGGMPVTGAWGDARRTWLGRAITGGDAADFGNRTAQITDSAALAEIQNMRDNSKTGGAVGNLTDGERVAIGNAVTAISNSTSSEEYLRAAKAYRELALNLAYGEGLWNLNDDGTVTAGSVPETLNDDWEFVNGVKIRVKK